MDVWKQIAVAFALVFVLEGLMPFLAPARWRDMVRQISQVDDTESNEEQASSRSDSSPKHENNENSSERRRA